MTYRVIQWATGAQGTEAIRAILDRPDLDLVGVKVHAAAKHGLDAGELVGRDQVGLAATTDIDAILGLDADCVSLPAAQRLARGGRDCPEFS